MGKHYKKRKKKISFRKIEFTRNAKMWIILGVSIALLLLISLIAKIDFLANITLGLMFTAPMLLARYQFSQDKFFENQKSNAIFIYAYIAVIWLCVIFPSAKIRWLLSFAYFIAGGIHLIYKARTISFKEDFYEDFILLVLAELSTCLMIAGLSITTEMTVLGWIFTAIFTAILFLPIAYFFLRDLSVSFMKKIGYNIIVLFLAFFLCWQITDGLNYSLDFSQPKTYQTTIITKKYNNNIRGRNSYGFYVYIDGERKEIEVTSDIYKKYEKGENIKLNIHQGALGMTYYTVD